MSQVICYGVATISRLLTIIGLFCKRALQKKPIFSKETYNFKESTTRSHPVPVFSLVILTRNESSESHIGMSQVTRINESYHTYEFEKMCHVLSSLYALSTCLGSECIMWVTYRNESCHTYKWVISHIRIRGVVSCTAYCIWSVVSSFSNLNR